MNQQPGKAPMADPTAVLQRVELYERYFARTDGAEPSKQEALWLCSQLRSALQDTQRLAVMQANIVWFRDGEECDAGLTDELDIPLIEAQGDLRKAIDSFTSTREARP